MKIYFKIIQISILILFLAGCRREAGNVGNIKIFPFPEIEAEWIRNGEPTTLENEAWYPQDSVDMLADSEVLLIGEYRGTQFFVEKTDVRPYNRLYSKFGQHKFRAFERNAQ